MPYYGRIISPQNLAKDQACFHGRVKSRVITARLRTFFFKMVFQRLIDLLS
jgi:hypothetical protein